MNGGGVRGKSMIYICLGPVRTTLQCGGYIKYLLHLLACADTPIYLVDEAPSNHFEQDDTRSRIQHLFCGGTVRFILEICIRAWTFAIDPSAHSVGY